MKFKYLLSLLIAGIPLLLSAQVRLLNASFEGEPHDAAVPDDWEACGIYSTPDILPGFWQVEQAPAEGNSFLGLITREDKTWEYIGQMLDEPLEENQCYSFSASLARSATYADYNRPVKFRIWGGFQLCDTRQMLGHTVPIAHEIWKTYEFVFVAKGNYRFITIEAYYADDAIAYNGNLLIDNCSPFEICDRVELPTFEENTIFKERAR